MISLGIHEFPVEVVDGAGNSVITLKSAPLTVYERRNGTCFFMDSGRRQDVGRLPNGGFHLRVLGS